MDLELPARAAAWRAAFPARLRATVERSVRALRGAGRLVDGAEIPELAAPPAFGDWLAAAMAEEERSGAHPSRLAAHYLDAMPALLVEQQLSTDEPGRTILHAPIAWPKLPRLSGAIDALFARVGAEGGLIGAPSADHLRAACPSLAALYARCHYGRFMPMLYAYPADLAAMARALATGEERHAVIDRHLAAPLSHELAHLGPSRRALQPPYLDECIAAWLGGQLLPASIWPGPTGDPRALFAAPWLAQVGHALARLVGAEALLRAHAGRAPWDALFAEGGTAALAALGFEEHLEDRAPHFLSATRRPDRWLKVLHLLAAGRDVLDGGRPFGLVALDELSWSEVPLPRRDDAGDRALLDAALRALCVRGVDDRGHLGAERALPPGPITVDAAACAVAAPGSPLDGGELRHFLPLRIAARLRAANLLRAQLTLEKLAALPEAAEAIAAGRPARGDGFVLSAW